MFLKTRLLPHWFAIFVSFLCTFCLVRIYEYFAVAGKFFVTHPLLNEVAGWVYDIWFCLIYAVVFFIPFFLLSLINKKLATVVLHIVNVVLLMMYLSLLITFSERNVPFDHEFFTRSVHESWLTSKQMMTSGFGLYIPFIIYIGFYFLFYNKVAKKLNPSKKLLIGFSVVSILSVCFIAFSNPNESWFKQEPAYYLTSNKFTYWVKDSYQYFSTRNNDKLTNAELEKEIDFYQKNHPFDFVSKEYPLLHNDTSKDVLGNFFNLDKNNPPNIVILVVEGLSRDFSGDKAYATSFTPFLDSLSTKSLVWDNFLSTAPGTFAAHPAISGSLPYGQRGFSVMNVMPDHLSLIKILRQNGYWTNFMIGFNPDFDNMGGYIRLQGTDFTLSKYPSKYKEMGVGEEGWSMGYPDDALFSRSFEVMDSLKKKRYLNIYHTATTHMPYLFEQSPIYSKLFDEKMKKINVSSSIKKTLVETKKVLITYMFADDCFKKFFADYAKRPEYNNTIFFITGDHHIGSFPSTGAIDDYHVPLIVYSPMLKQAKKFYSINSHNNLAPTITKLILDNYNVPYKPKQVHWLADVMDTATAFRNIQSMPFMEWSREISDYVYKDYFISGDQLYKLTPDLLQEKYVNDSLKKQMIRLRENFKAINKYVCDNNKIFPANQLINAGEKELLFDFTDTASKLIYAKTSDTSLMKDFIIPKNYKFLYVEVNGNVYMPSPEVDMHPSMRLALIDKMPKKWDYVYWTMREVATLSKHHFIPQQWNEISTQDMFTLDDYKNRENLVFNLGVWTDSIPINFKIKDLKVKIYGVK
jgi:uncharacterized sulfatase